MQPKKTVQQPVSTGILTGFYHLAQSAGIGHRLFVITCLPDFAAGKHIRCAWSGAATRIQVKVLCYRQGNQVWLIGKFVEGNDILRQLLLWRGVPVTIPARRQ